MSAPTPAPENGYLIVDATKLDPPTLNAVFGSLHERLVARETADVQEQETLDGLVSTSLAYIAGVVGPQIAAVEGTITALEERAAEAEDDIAALLATGVNASAISVTPGSGITATNAQAALVELQGEVAGALARTADPGEGTAGRFLRSNGDGSAAYAEVTSVLYREYEARADLRSINGPAGAMAVVRGLGLFAWLSGSTEPDDGETCFATSGGRWLVQAWSPDAVYAFWLAEIDRLNTLSREILFGSAVCSLTSVNTQAVGDFAADVPGSEPGDAVVVSPPSALESGASTGRLAYHAWVSAAGAVTIRIMNAASNAATLNAAVTGATNPWRVAVIKNIGA